MEDSKIIVEKLKDYFNQYVTLTEEFENILVDFLGKEAVTYTIEPIPTEYILKPYTDGSSLRQFVFQFSSREFYDESVAQQISNLGFYEKFQNEIERNNNRKILPDKKHKIGVERQRRKRTLSSSCRKLSRFVQDGFACPHTRIALQ